MVTKPLIAQLAMHDKRKKNKKGMEWCLQKSDTHTHSLTLIYIAQPCPALGVGQN